MIKKSESYSVMWFRRDLRLHDNHALSLALRSGHRVLPLFIFDRDILDTLENKQDRRVQFIHDQLSTIDRQLREAGSSLLCMHATVGEAFRTLLRDYRISSVYSNRDYEPAARTRDAGIASVLAEHSIAFHSVKDQVLFEEDEVMKDDGTPYTVFTPYSRKWKARLEQEDIPRYDSHSLMHSFAGIQLPPVPSLEELGFEPTPYPHYVPQYPARAQQSYDAIRNLPGLDATSHLSVHLRFGSVSVRECVREARTNSESWLNEFIWREFFMMILFHMPRVVTECFKPRYERIAWRNDKAEYEAWCEGKTGFPIVDAGMRELLATGFMHNRVRMVVASFLCKHLLIDWRWGEAFFAEKLLDYELSSNNGNWQWSAGCGCDAAPYFRVFNPTEQQRKFDPQLEYCKRWLDADDFMRPPIVDHAMARKRALEVYAKALKEG